MIIGITGRKRSGKDTVAHQLEQYGFFNRKISSPLKEALSALFGWDRSIMEDGPEKEIIDPRFGISPRQAMQFMGAEFNKHLGTKFPQYGEQTGTKLYMKRMMEYCKTNAGMNFVISDVRMPFTAEAIKEEGGFIIKVVRPGTESSDSHDTEKYIDEIEADVVINNNSTLDDLYMCIEDLTQSDNPCGRAIAKVIAHNTKG